jgi:hypothetical protein
MAGIETTAGLVLSFSSLGGLHAEDIRKAGMSKEYKKGTRAGLRMGDLNRKQLQR